VLRHTTDDTSRYVNVQLIKIVSTFVLAYVTIAVVRKSPHTLTSVLFAYNVTDQPIGKRGKIKMVFLCAL
jgi:hypothetical protein